MRKMYSLLDCPGNNMSASFQRVKLTVSTEISRMFPKSKQAVSGFVQKNVVRFCWKHFQIKNCSRKNKNFQNILFFQQSSKLLKRMSATILLLNLLRSNSSCPTPSTPLLAEDIPAPLLLHPGLLESFLPHSFHTPACWIHSCPTPSTTLPHSFHTPAPLLPHPCLLESFLPHSFHTPAC